MTNLSTQVLVIGGGATGLGVAWDAVLRGLKVVLVEQYDLAQGTSGRYHGLLHSGGRYVLSDPQSASECAHENDILRNIAPHTIEDTGGLYVSTPADPLDYPDRWQFACEELGVPTAELDLSELHRREPLLNPRISRAFEVQDASLDSFDLSHSLATSILAAGGKLLLRHRLVNLIRQGDHVVGAELRNLSSNQRILLNAEIVINATGPWAKRISHLAGVSMPMSLGKGTMVAMASRMVNTVINRLKPPSDGDIVVPVGTVCVLGTTDIPVDTPESLEIEPWEIDLLLAEGDFMIPGLSNARALRAWSGIRPLYNPDRSSQQTRTLARAHALLDHKELDGLNGFISIIGGKLTTYRLMAEETVNLVCDRLEYDHPCITADTPLQSVDSPRMFALPDRLQRYSQIRLKNRDARLICDCELVDEAQLKTSIESEHFEILDDLRRDLRLGMGPCQASFCAYRTAGLVSRIKPSTLKTNLLVDFLNERWKGLRPLAWGTGLQQMDLMRRIYAELLGGSGKGNSA